MKFKIKDRNFDELTTNLKLYPMMRTRLQTAPMDTQERQKKLDRLFEAELSNSIELLYYGYRYDCLEDILGKRDPNKPRIRGCCVNFGSSDSRRKCMYHICSTLAKLNLNVISSNSKLVFYYDDITTYIENHRKDNGSALLYDCDFWNLYFEFYDEYQRTKAITK